MSPKISIIVPVYNVAQYILRCLDSISNQTYYGDIECILVDDCGFDDSIIICEEYLKSYNGTIKFKLIYHEKNGGLSAARNSGLNHATGDYVYFLDSDDAIPSNAMELLAAEVERHPQIDVVMGFMYDDKKSDFYNLDLFKSNQYVTDKRWLQYYSFKYGKRIPVNGCNKLIRRDFILKNELFFKTGLLHEDEHWMFYLVKYVNSWAFVFEPTYIRFWNDGSIMTSLNRDKEAGNWYKIMFDHSSNFYGQFYKLQLLRYIDMYFGRRIFEYHFPECSKLHRNFIKSSLKQHLWLCATLLFFWSALYNINDGFKLKYLLMRYSRKLYVEESEKRGIMFFNNSWK